MKKILSMVLVLVLVAGIAVSGTMAYLTDRDNETNVFTVGDVDIELEGTFAKGVELLPGKTVAINPVIKNVGKNDAWVWLTYAVPTKLAGAIEVVAGDNSWAAQAGTPDAETGYTIYPMLYNTALAAGAATNAAFSTIGLDKTIDITPDGDWYKVVGGQTTDLQWNTDDGAPAVYVNAYAIQMDQFANVDAALAAYTTQWGKLNGEMEELTVTEVATAAEMTKAVAAGGVVVLTDDIDMDDETLTVSKYTAINLNGQKLSGTCEVGQDHLIMVKNGATLDITDSSAGKNGKITYAKGSSGTGWTIDAEGNVNLYSGTIELTGDDWSIGYAVDVRPNAWGTAYTSGTVFHMYGGKIISSDGAVRVASSSYDKYNVAATFIMDGGEIDAAWDGIFVQQSNDAYDTLTVEINDGTVKSALSPIRVYGPEPVSVNSGAAKPMTITAKSDSLVLNGTLDTSRTWYVDGKIVIGGGMTLDNLEQYSTITLK